MLFINIMGAKREIGDQSFFDFGSKTTKHIKSMKMIIYQIYAALC